MKKRILFIVNPISGTTSKTNITEKIDAWLDHDLYDHDLKETR